MRFSFCQQNGLEFIQVIYYDAGNAFSCHAVSIEVSRKI